MDDHIFDSLIRLLAQTTVERRQTLKGLAGIALGLALGQSALANLAAKKKKRKGKRKKHRTRPGCARNCAGRACGDDGCGKSCGACDEDSSCVDTADGTICQAGECTRDCAGKTCGGDGCGGFCGSCPEDYTCNGGSCQCAAGLCGGICCDGNQICISGECWPDGEEQAFRTLLNNHRAANGLPALSLQNQLGRAAELHSQDQADHRFSDHTGSDGSEPNERIAAAGYTFSYWGENIYYGGGSASEAFNWWKNSSGHNASMLSPNFTEFGIGRSFSSVSGYWYWTTTFGRP